MKTDNGARGTRADLEGYMDLIALIFMSLAVVMFVFAASGRELRHFNEIALGLVFVTLALIAQFTQLSGVHISR